MPSIGSLGPGTQNSPARQQAAITPSDAVPIVGGPCRAIYVGTTGDVTMILQGDTVAVTWSSVPAGSILPVFVTMVKATGTTASNMVALF